MSDPDEQCGADSPAPCDHHEPRMASADETWIPVEEPHTEVALHTNSHDSYENLVLTTSSTNHTSASRERDTTSAIALHSEDLCDQPVPDYNGTTAVHDDNLKGLVQAYQSLTSVSRPLLKEMCERFIDDPTFRNYVQGYVRPPVIQKSPSATFRFLDLRMELRIGIAKYAMRHRRTALWNWRRDESDAYYGFHGMQNGFPYLTAISQVSRQLYNETRDLIFQVNDLTFFGLRSSRSFGIQSELPNALLEYRYFKERASLRVVAAIRSVNFVVDSGPKISDALQWLNEEAEEMQNVSSTLLLYEWDMEEFATQADANKFVETGHKMAALINEIRRRHLELRIRLKPYNPRFSSYMSRFSSPNPLEKHLSAEEYKLALHWINQRV